MSHILKAVLGDLDTNAEVKCADILSRAAFVATRHAGVAYGFWNRDHPDIVSSAVGERLQGMDARGLAQLSLSDDPFEASLGVAAINSLLRPCEGRLHEQNGLERALERAQGRRLAVVGHFSFVEHIRSAVEKLWVLEVEPREGDLPAALAPEIIPQADVVILTGTTLVNHTVDGLLDLARGKEIIMMGPTTILHPALFDFGVHALCGVSIDDPDRTRAHLKAGGGMRHLEGVRKVALIA
jgi:hypothetical protein